MQAPPSQLNYLLVESLAKLLYGIASWASILFGWVVCGDLNSHESPPLKVYAIGKNPIVLQADISSWYDFPNSPCDQQSLAPWLPLAKTLVELTRTLNFWFEWINPANSYLSLCPHSALTSPCDPLRHSGYSSRTCNKLHYLHFFLAQPSSTLCAI